ncbi:MAG: GlsB/YeaQ/YmgE family stress response membrane protein [Solirubrobacteraceae bacterium]
MEFVVYLVVLGIWGLFVGAFARLALPGPDPMSLLQTMAIGLAGSFIAGLVVYLVSGQRTGAGFLGALVCSVLIVYFIRRSRGGGLTRPGGDGAPRRF